MTFIDRSNFDFTYPLVAELQFNIQIKDKEGALLYQRPCASAREVRNFMYQNGESRKGWCLIKGTVVPLRTENLKVFSKDFFLPTFVNCSLKVNNLAVKIITSIFAIALDVITAPIRLLTTPFRIYYHYRHPEVEHSLVDLIEGNPQSQKAIEAGFVTLCYEALHVKIDEPPVIEEGDTLQTLRRTLVRGTMQVALKRIPGGVEDQFSETVEKEYYQTMNGTPWVLESYASETVGYLYHYLNQLPVGQ